MRFRLPLVLTLLLASAASAAALDVDAGDLDRPVAPLAEAAVVSGTLAVPCAEEAVAVDLSVAERPPWANATIVPATVVAPAGCEGVHVASFDVAVSVTKDAPAFTPQPVRIVARAGNATASDDLHVTAGFFSILDAQAESTILLGKPQSTVTFPIRVENFGNANTKVAFELVSIPDGWRAPTPVSVVLESRQHGGTQTSVVVPLAVQTPYRNGYLNEVGAFTLRITSQYALDSALPGDATEVSVLANVKGTYVPAGGALAALAAVGGAALALGAARRR